LQHFAARFAAKEALVKAMGQGFAGYLDLHEMEITHDANGAPMFFLTGEAQRTIAQLGLTRIHVSLTHIRSAACAVVILEQ
jgi:holo-[acyl-carrier protein] synthase